MAEIVSQYRIDVTGAVESLNKVADATEGTEKSLKKAGEAGKTTGKEIADAGKMGEAAIGSMSPMLGRVIGGFKSMIGGVKAAIMAMNTLKAAIAATGIGLLLLAIGAMVTAASKVQPVIDKVRVVFAQLGTAVSVVIDRVAAFGAGLFDILSGDVTGGIDKIRNSFKGIGDEIEREIALAGRLEEQLIRIEKAKIITSTTVSKLRAEIEKLNATYGDTTVSLGEQLAAQQKILKLREQLSDLQVRDAQERIANALGQETVNEKVQSFIDRMTTANNVLLTTSERAKVAEELIKEIGISESTVSDLENVAGLIDQLIQAESERFQGTRRTNSAITSLANQQRQIEQQRLDDARKSSKELTDAEEDRLAALDKASDEKLKKRLAVDAFISERTAMGLKEEMDAAILAEQQKAMLMEADALNVGLSQDKIEAIRQASVDEQLRIQNEYGAKIQEIEDAGVQAVKDAEEEKKKLREKAFDKFRDEFQQFTDLSTQAIDLISQAQQAATDNELAMLAASLEAGQITREEYDKKRKELLKEQAEENKALALAQATINGAMASINAYAEGGPIAAAIAAIFAAAQISIIAAQPIPQFEEGGRVGGKRHAQGGTLIEAEDGEFVVNRRSTSKNFALIDAINKGVEDAYIMRNWVAPAVDSALLNGWQDVGKSADLNGITANLKDHNIIRALDRNREATTYGLALIADRMNDRKTKRGGYA